MTDVRRFKANDVTGQNFDKMDLSGAEFVECDLSGSSFVESDLTGCRFIRCFTKDHFVNFTGARATGTQWNGCRLHYAVMQGIDLSGAHLRGSDFSHSNFQLACLDDAHLEDTTLSMVDLHLVSLRNVRIADVVHEPALRVTSRQLFRLLWKSEIPKRTIYTAGTEMSPFIQYCTREYRLSQIVSQIEHKSRWGRVGPVLLLMLVGISSDFGQSLTKWLLTAGLTIGGFGAYFMLAHSNKFDGGEAMNHAVLHFMNQGNQVIGPSETLLNIFGYFMLGLFIAILTNRFVNRW